jgi:hypothetical protein
MAVDINGDLLETDDGGIYRRRAPQTNTGDWFSMNGDLQTTEFHSVAWDANAHIMIGGAQDTGTPQQQVTSGATWSSVSAADGAVAVADDTSRPGLSTRYSSYQFLGGLRREVYDAANVKQSEVFLPLVVVGGGFALQPQFYTPIESTRRSSSTGYSQFAWSSALPMACTNPTIRATRSPPSRLASW